MYMYIYINVLRTHFGANKLSGRDIVPHSNHSPWPPKNCNYLIENPVHPSAQNCNYWWTQNPQNFGTIQQCVMHQQSSVRAPGTNPCQLAVDDDVNYLNFLFQRQLLAACTWPAAKAWISWGVNLPEHKNYNEICIQWQQEVAAGPVWVCVGVGNYKWRWDLWPVAEEFKNLPPVFPAFVSILRIPAPTPKLVIFLQQSPDVRGNHLCHDFLV